ncbi:MAG: hypothetical protein AAFZ52_06645, partial [Bacteroidota bacterium]
MKKTSTQLFLFIAVLLSGLLPAQQQEPCPAPEIDDVEVCDGEPTVIRPNGDSRQVIFLEDFQGDPVDYTAFGEFNNGSNDHFGVTDGSNISNVSGAYSFEGDGNFFIAAEDTNADGSSSTKTVVTTLIDITGLTGLEICLDVAAGNENGPGASNYDAADFLVIEYFANNDTTTNRAGRFSYLDGGDAFNEPFHSDPDQDGDGADGVQILTTAQQFCFPVPASSLPGATGISIRIRLSMDAGSEEVAFDNLLVTAEAPMTAFNFYDADPTSIDAVLLAENVTEFDPMTTVATSPQTVFATLAEEGCETSATPVTVTVNPLPEVAFTAPEDACVGTTLIPLTGGSPAGGVYTGEGVVFDAVGGGSFFFLPFMAGTTTITYTVFDETTECSNSASDDIEVFALPEVSFTPDPTTFCDGDADGQTVSGGAPAGGVYSGDNVTDDGNGETFTFNPASAGVGFTTVTYTFTDENGCSASAEATITVEALPAAPEVSDVAVCAGEETLLSPEQPPVEPLVIYTEAFGEDFAGVTGACSGAEASTCATNNAPSNGQWSLTGDFSGIVASSDYFRVEEGALTARDVDEEVCFLSAPINISGFTSVDFSAQVDEEGDHEPGDYADVTLIVDGVETLITNFMGLGSDEHTLIGDIPDDMDWGMASVTASGLSGSVLQVEICVFNGAGSEFILLDDVTVIGTPAPVAFNFYDADPAGDDATLLAGPVATFNPGTTPETSPQTIFVTSATEPCESAATAVTVTVEAAPEVDCPDTITVALNEAGMGVVDFSEVEFTVAESELCDPVDDTIMQGFPVDCSSGDTLVENVVQVLFASGAVSGCDILVSIQDNEAPVVEASDTTLFLDENGLATLSVDDFQADVSDNCTAGVTDLFRVEEDMSDNFAGANAGAKSLARTLSFTCDDLGNIDLRVEIVATDDAGNESRDTITVTVLDTLAPVISCVSDTIYLDAEGIVADAPGENVTIEEDNCPPDMIIGSPLLTFTCDEVGINEFTQTRTDESGNESEPCTFTVTVLDTIAPVLTVTPTDVTLDLNGEAMLTVPDLAVASDACGIESVTAERLDFGCDDIGLVFVAVTATDVNGNVSVDSTPVTVDFEQPQFACIEEINATLDENCSFTLIPSQFITGNTACLDAFQFDIVVMDGDTTNGPVIDGCGRFAYVIRSVGTGIFDLDFETCWGYVNAEDKTPPVVVSTPDDVELLCVDIEDNNINLLPAGVSHCYEVRSSDGSIINGTIQLGLFNALRAGGTDPLVPIFTDACTGRIEVCVNDILVYDEDDPQCNDAVLTRTFTATEIAVCSDAPSDANESVTTSYQINFTRPTLDDLNDDNIDLVVEYEQCGVVNPSRADYPAPRPEDFPFLSIGDRTFPLTTGTSVCNIAVQYEDSAPFQTCDYTYKFFRTYQVFDWCNPGERREFIQTVKVGDTTAPDFFGPTQDRDFDGIVDGDLIYSTNAGNECAAFIRLDPAGVRAVDECDPSVTITAQIFPGGDLNARPIGAFEVDPNDGNAEISSAIPVGCHLLRYTATDACDNVTIADYDFCVEDGTAPVAICEDGLNIGITSGSASDGTATGIAVLTPDMIDNGSYDDCSAITLAI